MRSIAPARHFTPQFEFPALCPSGHLQFVLDMCADFTQVVIDEVTKFVVGNAPELSPFSEGAN